MEQVPDTNASTTLEERLLPGQAPVLTPGHTLETVTDKIVSIVLRRPVTLGWLGGFVLFFGLLNLLLFAAAYLFYRGVGIWGINIPVGWGFAIVNFVWWIGIGHAGTLISAILLLLKQGWRNSINRFAEAMTLFAVACAGMFPLLHMGRPWLAYWLFPYPNTMGVWPQFRSPLLWDVFAVSTYATISALFWFIGLIPGSGDLPRHGDQPGGQDHLRIAGHGLARFGAALEALRERLPAAGRTGDAAGALGAHGRVLRLRNFHSAGLAHHGLSALFCRRRHLFGLCHGAGAGDSDPQLLRRAGHDHLAPPG